MSTSGIVTGRPRTACDKCKDLKIRCSTRRPICDRCLRLGHACVYSKDTVTGAKITKRFKKSQGSQASQSAITCLNRSSTDLQYQKPSHGPIRPATGDRAFSIINSDGLGISKELIRNLSDIYFRHVYNAGLLLHEPSFLKAIANSTASTHVVLSVCAWGAKFYQDEDGALALKENGCMEEWATRAGELAFKEAERLRSDNIATHMNLCLFWFSEGKWPRAYIHKAQARALIQVLGTVPKKGEEDTLKSELRRRRFWAHYVMECHMPSPGPPENRRPIMKKMPLPWTEDEFTRGHKNATTNEQGLYAEMIRILTLWADVNYFIRSHKDIIRENVATVYKLDEELRDWWQSLQSPWKLSVATLDPDTIHDVSRVLLINVAYHQCLFSLHAAVLPLFSADTGTINWNTARQLSAQIAFEHASATSSLITAALATSIKVSTIPHFVAWSGYSACAILIAFLQASEDQFRARASAMVIANGRLVSELGKFWRFARLLEGYLANLMDAYNKHHVVLEDEPKNLAIARLSNFRIKSEYARASILGYIQVLENDEEGLVEPGEEKLDLELEEDDDDDPQHATSTAAISHPDRLTAISFSGTSEIGPGLVGEFTLPDLNTAQGQLELPMPALETFTTSQMPDMHALTTHPWNEFTAAFDQVGWGPDLWQFFSAPSFNS